MMSMSAIKGSKFASNRRRTAGCLRPHSNFCTAYAECCAHDARRGLMRCQSVSRASSGEPYRCKETEPRETSIHAACGPAAVSQTPSMRPCFTLKALQVTCEMVSLHSKPQGCIATHIQICLVSMAGLRYSLTIGSGLRHRTRSLRRLQPASISPASAR